jgi:hypothetical protein
MTEALEGKLLQLKAESENEPWKKYFGAVSSTPQDQQRFRTSMAENFETRGQLACRESVK